MLLIVIVLIADISAVLSLRDINLQSVVHSGTCTVTFKARHVGLSIPIGGMVQDGLLWDIDNGPAAGSCKRLIY
jgi:hypothetical protein